MRITPLVAALLTTASTAVHAQLVDASYISAVVSALKAANLTAFANAAQTVAFYTSTEGASFLASMSASDKTMFVPTNEAFASLPQSVLDDTPLLVKIFSYHVLDAAINPNEVTNGSRHMVAGSLYQNSMLPGNQSQAVVFDLVDNAQTGNQSFAFRYQENNATVYVDTVPVSGSMASFMIYPINTVLSLPRSLGDAAASFLPSLAGLMNQAGLYEHLIETKGITIFAPNDAAVSASGALFNTLASTQVHGVLSNHIINGTVMYSNVSDAAGYTSAGGEPFRFTTNATGTYVTSGDHTAQIITPDIPIANGVVHIIDRVLANANSNTAAAQSAASSYAAQVTETAVAKVAKGGAMRSIPFSVEAAGSAVAIFAGIYAGAAFV